MESSVPSKRDLQVAASDPDVDALRTRVAMLEAREAEHARSEQIQRALYRLAEAASAASDLQAFYREVHAAVGTLMNAENFYIALYDEQRQAINFAYYADSVDLEVPDPNLWEPIGVGNARGTTAYVLRQGRPIRLLMTDFADLVAAGELEEVGVVIPDGEWLGAPLVADRKTVGVVVCQTYGGGSSFAAGDLDVLAVVGQHLGAALSRARAIEETRQRNAELGLINEIGQALAEQLEFGAIIELVGNRIREIFASRSLFIALHDGATDMLSFPYDIDEGERFDRGTHAARSGNRLDGDPDRPIVALRHPRGHDRAGRRAGRRVRHRIVARRAHPGRQPGDRGRRPREPSCQRVHRGR